MGYESSTNIGIYLIVPFGTKEEKTSFYVHPDTGHKMKSKFCPDTGVEGLKKTKVKTVKKSPSPLGINGLDENLFFTPPYCGAKDGYKTFVYNYDDKYSKSLDDKNEFNFNLSLMDNPDELIKEFVHEYGDQIKLIEKKYGKVEVNYGIIKYIY